MKSVNRFILDLHSVQSQVSVPILLGDTAREWLISFSNGGEQFILKDGTLAKIEIKRPTGTYLENFCTILNNTTVAYEFDNNTAVVEGVHRVNIVLYDAISGKRIASPGFAMVVSSRVINSDDINLTDEDLTIIDGIVAAEAIRESSETTRINNEASRVSAENARVNAEKARVSAENARQTNTTSAIERINTKTSEVTQKLANGDFVGKTGEDGFSPTIEAQEITGGYKLTIVDKNGTKSIDILNGAAGEDGSVVNYSIAMDLDYTTYKLTLKLLDGEGNTVDEETVDFPIENVVVSGDEENGIVTLTLVNGSTISFEIGDLVSGLVSTAVFEAKVKNIENSIKASELVANKVTTLSSSSTDTQYPSAKCVYNAITNAITTTLNTEV